MINMRRIILFRFHKNPRVCKNRLDILKKLNPDVEIFGYIENKNKYKKFKRSLDPYLENVYFIKEKNSYWFWKNGDLATRIWYKNFGINLNFDMLHIIEWDLLLLKSLDELYEKIPKDAIGLTALTPLSKVEDRWSWTTKKDHLAEWKKLLKFVKKEFNYSKKNYASLGPGVCLPKAFLEKFSSVNVPALSNDELRLPLFGRVFDFRLYDTGFYRKWFNDNEKKFFNCMDKEIEMSKIKKELSKPLGRRAFHPFRKIFDIKLLDKK